MSKPWTEKYRPKDFSEMVHQETATSLLHASIGKGTVPHMLFYGPPGTGKTSAALLVGRKLFRSAFKTRVLEFNASDDRGIDTVRQQIKDRASRTFTSSENIHDFQLIILDEADCMTRDAQKALLRTMEVYSAHTRFIVICNYVSRIISPLASRCAKIRFQSFPITSMRDRLDWICKQEQLQVDPDCMEILMKAAKGDLRRAIMLLESTAKFSRNHITQKGLLDISGHVPDEVVDMFLVESGKSLQDCHTVVKDIVYEGYSAQQLLLQLSEKLLISTDYNELQKAEIFEILAQADYCLSTGTNESLQLLTVGSKISKTTDQMIMG